MDVSNHSRRHTHKKAGGIISFQYIEKGQFLRNIEKPNLWPILCSNQSSNQDRRQIIKFLSIFQPHDVACNKKRY